MTTTTLPPLCEISVLVSITVERLRANGLQVDTPGELVALLANRPELAQHRGQMPRWFDTTGPPRYVSRTTAHLLLRAVNATEQDYHQRAHELSHG